MATFLTNCILNCFFSNIHNYVITNILLPPFYMWKYLLMSTVCSTAKRRGSLGQPLVTPASRFSLRTPRPRPARYVLATRNTCPWLARRARDTRLALVTRDTCSWHATRARVPQAGPPDAAYFSRRLLP